MKVGDMVMKARSLNKLLLVIIIIELLIILVDKLKDVVPVQLILG